MRGQFGRQTLKDQAMQPCEQTQPDRVGVRRIADRGEQFAKLTFGANIGGDDFENFAIERRSGHLTAMTLSFEHLEEVTGLLWAQDSADRFNPHETHRLDSLEFRAFGPSELHTFEICHRATNFNRGEHHPTPGLLSNPASNVDHMAKGVIVSHYRLATVDTGP